MFSLSPSDDLLPRVVDLALNSSDRQTKVAASELLHSTIIVMIGIGNIACSFSVNYHFQLYEFECHDHHLSFLGILPVHVGATPPFHIIVMIGIGNVGCSFSVNYNIQFYVSVP